MFDGRHLTYFYVKHELCTNGIAMSNLIIWLPFIVFSCILILRELSHAMRIRYTWYKLGLPIVTSVLKCIGNYFQRDYALHVKHFEKVCRMRLFQENVGVSVLIKKYLKLMREIKWCVTWRVIWNWELGHSPTFKT